MSQKHQEVERDGKVIWDMGSSLYDSYGLASLNQILDRHLTGLPFPDESLQKRPTGALLPRERRNNKQVVMFGAHKSWGGKVTMRALFRAVATGRSGQGRRTAVFVLV